MTRFARVLCLIYGATFVFLAWAAVQSGMANSVWASLLFTAASIVPILAWLRETEHAEATAETRADIERAARVRDQAATNRLRTALDDLKNPCCELWWTSCGFEHDSTCQRQRRAA